MHCGPKFEHQQMQGAILALYKLLPHRVLVSSSALAAIRAATTLTRGLGQSTEVSSKVRDLEHMCGLQIGQRPILGGAESMAMKFHGNSHGKVQVYFLALFASKPHIFMCSALKLFRIVRANVRLHFAIPIPFWFLKHRTTFTPGTARTN